MRFFALLMCVLVLPVQAQLRVVSLAPSLTELMLELGAAEQLVGVLGERPKALAALPSVGQVGQLEFESLLSLQPDLLLLWPDSVSAAQRQQLRNLHIPLFEAEPRSLEQLASQVAELGARVGRAAQGRELALQAREELTRLRARYQRLIPLRVFYQVWDKPLYTLGGEQIISDALRVCGARNLFADLPLAAPQISLEAVLARDPEVILVSEPQLLAAWQAWPQLQAVQRRQVWLIPDRGLERPSLQMLKATAQLCELLRSAR